MQVGAVDSIYSAYEPYDVSTDNIEVSNNNTNENNSISVNATNGLEAPATAVAINPNPQESIELQELQDEIVSIFDDLKEGNISEEDLASSLEELGIEVPQSQTENEPISNNDKNNQSILDLTSALIESVKGNSNGEVELSAYASIMDIVNEEIQTPEVNEQLQAYTQNLRN